MAVPALLRVTHFPEMAAELLQGTAELLSIAANKQKNKKRQAAGAVQGSRVQPVRGLRSWILLASGGSEQRVMLSFHEQTWYSLVYGFFWNANS